MSQEVEVAAASQLKLPNIVCSRNYPFTALGDAQLRAIREHYKKVYLEKNPGSNMDIPFPTALHLMMNEFCQMKGIELLEEDQTLAS